MYHDTHYLLVDGPTTFGLKFLLAALSNRHGSFDSTLSQAYSCYILPLTDSGVGVQLHLYSSSPHRNDSTKHRVNLLKQVSSTDSKMFPYFVLPCVDHRH